MRLAQGKAGKDPVREVSRPALSLLINIVEGGKGEKDFAQLCTAVQLLQKPATIHRSLGESDKGIS